MNPNDLVWIFISIAFFTLAFAMVSMFMVLRLHDRMPRTGEMQGFGNELKGIEQRIALVITDVGYIKRSLSQIEQKME